MDLTSWLARSSGVALAIGCSLALAACGSSSSASSSTTSSGGGGAGSGTSNAQNAAQTRLTDCLHQQGLDVDFSKPSSIAGSDRDKLRAAIQGPCQKYAKGAFGNADPNDPAQQDRQTKFTQCLRDEGVDVPNFDAGSGPPPSGSIDPNDPKVQSALQACQKKTGFAGPGGTQ